MWKRIKIFLVCKLLKQKNRSYFTGLEIKTYLKGEVMTTCLFPIERAYIPETTNHTYLMPIHLEGDTYLQGYTVDIHKFNKGV